MNPKEFLEFNFWFDKEIPKYSVKLKRIYIEGKAYPKNKNGMPISSSVLEYFTYFLGDDIGKSVYEFRKPFFNKEYALEYAKNNNLIEKKYYSLIEEYLHLKNKKMKKNHAEAIKKPEYKEKLKKSYNRALHSQIKKDWFAIPENKKKYYEATQNPEVSKRRAENYKNWVKNGGREILIIAANKPERIEKIRNAAKEMWRQAKINKNYKKLAVWHNNGYNKKYKLLDYNVNKIEYEFGLILLEFKAEFEYEKQTETNNLIFYPDFLLEKQKIIFECYGDYWHGNPQKYDKDYILFDGIKCSEKWSKDQLRKEELEKIGYKVHCFWEHDIINNKDFVKQKVKEILNENKQI